MHLLNGGQVKSTMRPNVTSSNRAGMQEACRCFKPGRFRSGLLVIKSESKDPLFGGLLFALSVSISLYKLMRLN